MDGMILAQDHTLYGSLDMVSRGDNLKRLKVGEQRLESCLDLKRKKLVTDEFMFLLRSMKSSKLEWVDVYTYTKE